MFKLPAPHRVWLTVFVLAACNVPAVTAQNSGEETNPEVRLTDILPAAVLRSSDYQVADGAQLRGNHLEVSVESEFGAYLVDSLPMLLQRIHEIRTLSQAIDNFNRSNKQLAIKLRGQLKVGADSFVQIIGRPLRTSGKLANQLGANVDETFKELNQQSSADPRQANSRSALINPTDPILAAHKRSIANQLDLDVYSTNPRVQSFLDEVATARGGGKATAGTLSVGLGKPLQKAVAGGAVDAATRSAVARNSAADLQQRNARKLSEMNIGDPLIDAFLGHPQLSPRRQTEIIEYLSFIGNISNRSALLQAALSARDETQAAGYVETARLLSLYHENQRRLSGLLAADHLLVARASDRTMVVVLPFDVVYWNARTAQVFGTLAEHAKASGYQHSELVVAGLVTPVARRQIEVAGFKVFDRFGLQP
jgi:hypothetical protein